MIERLRIAKRSLSIVTLNNSVQFKLCLDAAVHRLYPAYVNNKGFTVDPLTNRLGVPQGQSGVMEYDPAGNLTRDTYSRQTYSGNGTRNYDAENRMTGAEDGCGNLSYYTYSADGQRVRRKVMVKIPGRMRCYRAVSCKRSKGRQ